MFSAAQVHALQILVRLWSIQRFVLVGASAMNWHLGERSRETHDLDLILAVPLARYPAGIDTEPGWSRHPRREQTWLAPGDVYVDIIPLEAAEPGATVLTWPESGFQMSLAGLRLALDQAVTIQPAPGLAIRVAPLDVLALLKMVAFLDRPNERDRDLADIALILDEYVGDVDERRYGGEILDLALGYDEASPFLLGRRLAAIVNQPEREAVRRFIGSVKGTGDALAAQARMLVNAPPRWHRRPEELLLRVAAFERGFGAAVSDE